MADNNALNILLLEINDYIRRCIKRCLITDLHDSGFKTEIKEARWRRDAFVALEEKRFDFVILNQNQSDFSPKAETLSDYIRRRFPLTPVLLKNNDFWVVYTNGTSHVFHENPNKIIVSLSAAKKHLRIVS